MLKRLSVRTETCWVEGGPLLLLAACFAIPSLSAPGCMYSVEMHYDELQDSDCGVIEARGPEFALRDRRNPRKPEL